MLSFSGLLIIFIRAWDVHESIPIAFSDTNTHLRFARREKLPQLGKQARTEKKWRNKDTNKKHFLTLFYFAILFWSLFSNITFSFDWDCDNLGSFLP